MPDKDIFDRTFAPGWTNPARKINKIGNPEIAAHVTARALRKDLQALGGFPDVKKLYSVLSSFQNENGLATSEKVFKQIRDFERTSNNRDIAGFLGKACLQTHIEIAEKQRQANRDESADTAFPSQKEFMKSILSKFMVYRFHGKVEFFEHSEQGGDYWHDSNFRHAYYRHLDFYVELIAEALNKDSTFSHPPKFPRVKQIKQSIEDIMYSPLRLIEE